MNQVFFYIYPVISQLLKRFPLISLHRHLPIRFMELQTKNPLLLQSKQPSSWQSNKIKMLQILKNAPVAGIYKNQNKSNWDKFFEFYVNFLSSQTGPRGQCTKKIRKQLILYKEQVDLALSPYNLNHTMHIRSLYTRFKYFLPCHQYHLYQTTTQTLTRSQQSLSRIKQPQHPMYKSIMQGMIKKRGPDFNYVEEIKKLEENYEKRILKLREDKLELQDKLSQMKQYQDWVRMNQVMGKWFDEWVEADSGMGKDSCSRGEIFQTKVLNNVIPYIMAKQQYGVLSHIKNYDQMFTQQFIQQLINQSTQPTSKKSKIPPFHILLNTRWQPRSLGEIDIALVQFNTQRQRYQALVLIQCKARLFDIRQASYQVFGEYLKRDQKTVLSGKYGPVYLSDKVVSYIVTTLPDYEFVLPIESELKACMDRITKDMPIENISQAQTKEVLFKECTKRFANQLSPLEWFVQNDSDRIIVLAAGNNS